MYALLGGFDNTLNFFLCFNFNGYFSFISFRIILYYFHDELLQNYLECSSSHDLYKK